ncbi:adenylate/guanylate cyclase domain-containing protein [Fimbriimonas ginsengisoli]|uniref:Guanylate cyclase domain-containing protein n=1 Tax=Fimbriimonas ginsengisoli Gsoil 348 TaxID=661478 RepID=A0A068NK77_FIMGI|nr:adenylate/guanylate cyclase domain-containing protein [Fimbriimonas ginsengisoli]AIE83857.1 hypothetical protein OP10G_0489 [Fimbriimonas ginsengisoli Gsoil 348]
MEGTLRQRHTKLDESKLGEDSVDQMIVLAERLREASGGEIDESAIQAVAEATGAPLEYVRLAVKLRTEKEKHGFLATVRSQFFTLEPQTRRFVIAGLTASGCALLIDIEKRIALSTGQPFNRVFSMLALCLAGVGLYNIGISRDTRQAAISGAIFGAGYCLMQSVFGLLLGLRMYSPPELMVVMAIAGAVMGAAIQKIVERNREKLGLKDPVQERQELLRQLHHLREKLHTGEQSLTFVSVDIVGSTRLKQQADPLAVEYTFNEYLHFVERVTTRYGGRVHSTAGDGVISAFDSPSQAFLAAKNIQTEILELNTFRNKIGSPIVLRCGMHTGTVVTPEAGDVTSLNFADVIDIASHLQKVAPPGGIAVSDMTAHHLPGGPDSVGTTRVEAHDTRGVVWSPRTSLTAASLNAPPLPNQA